MTEMSFPSYFTCQQMVELVTDYLEDKLLDEDRLRFDEHIAACEPCSAYVTQMRETIRMTGELREEDVPPDVQQHLLQTFREWNAGR